MLLRLLPGEAVVGAAAVAAGADVLLASRLGQVKRLEGASLRPCQRGDLGQIGLRFLDRGDALVDLCEASAPLVSVLVGEGRHARLLPEQLERQDTCGSGDSLKLRPGESVQALVPLIC